MVFSTVTFLFYFLPFFLLCYAFLPFKNITLLVASLIFYTWGEPQNLPLLLISILLNYLFGLAIGQAQGLGRTGKPAFIAGIVVNLACLAYFKYFNFAEASLAELAKFVGLAMPVSESVALPLGISFYTFHAISYLADVYRKKTPYERNLFALAMYIVMFPQLIAGPIIRFATIARQIHHRHHSPARIALGSRIFMWGLAQKVLIANTVALTADKIFSLPADALGMPSAWLGISCYTLQIYFDFFGYSNMAIGLGLITGFTFPCNFNYPYIAQSITEFWQRWHLSLSRWFRDYVYIPLGGNRGAPWRTYMNLCVVFFLCGLWHGANWTFVFWGLYHGGFLVLERAGLSKLLSRLPSLLRHVYALLVVMVGWVFFRCDTFAQAATYLRVMFGGAALDNSDAPVMTYLGGALVTALLLGLIAATPILEASADMLKKASRRVRGSGLGMPAVLWHGGAILMMVMPFPFFILALISLASGSYNPFIYFRF